MTSDVFLRFVDRAITDGRTLYTPGNDGILYRLGYYTSVAEEMQSILMKLLETNVASSV